MSALYPLRFDPIFKTMLWGGTRLRPFLGRPPSDELTGEAWVLSDVDGSPSVVKNGPLTGRTLKQVLAEYPTELLGAAKPINGRFPLLLKFLDAKQELSVQVHPTDAQASAKTPGAAGKTEAWVVLEANPATSKLYAGFNPGITAATFRDAMTTKTTPATLYSFPPQPGDCLFLRANTVHAIGRDLLLFEVQQTSDITYRIYDWDRIDAKTGKGRDLHIDDGLACSDFTTGPCQPVTPVREGAKERLVSCDYFTLHRTTTSEPTTVGANGRCVAAVVVSGKGTLAGEPVACGDVVLLPASVGVAAVVPDGVMTVLECSTM